MENTTPIIEPELQPNLPLPETPVPEIPKKKSPLVLIFLGVAVLILGGIFGILLRKNVTSQPTPTASNTAVPTPTPAVNRPLSAIASTSAFLQTESAIASLSAAAAALNVSDTTLNPPSLDLPLGLETK